MSTAREMIEYYLLMQGSGSSMLREIEWQYTDMAVGGDGGRLHYKPIDWDGTHPQGPTCREYNYPGKPDTFFQEVCDGMGWVWRGPHRF